MFRKPEFLEIVVLVVSVPLFLLSVAYLYFVTGSSTVPFPDVVLLVLSVSVVCVIGGTIFRMVAVRYGFLFFQCFLTIVLLGVVASRVALIEVAVVMTMIAQFSMRLTRVRAVVLGCALLLAQLYMGIRHGSSVLERVMVLFPCAVALLLWDRAVVYRQLLVERSAELEANRQSLRNLAAANQSFVEYLEDVEADSAERERFRITRELHDSIGYSMTNITMMMNASRYLVRENGAKLVEYCQKTKELASSTLRETRDILYKLRSIRGQRSSNARIFFAKLCNDFSTATSVETEFEAGNLPGSLGENVFNILFRAVQVAFINALRHGNAERIRLQFWMDQSELRMSVWNSTTHAGQNDAAVTEGIGLSGMRERLVTVGGSATHHRVADGFELVVTIPREELDAGTHTGAHS